VTWNTGRSEVRGRQGFHAHSEGTLDYFTVTILGHGHQKV
jgi:hypothetical protein